MASPVGRNSPGLWESEENVKRRKEAAERRVRERHRMLIEQTKEAHKKTAEERIRLMAELKEKEAKRMKKEQEELNKQMALLERDKARKQEVLARQHAASSRTSGNPKVAFGSTTPRELSYLDRLPKNQKTYDQKLTPPKPPANATPTRTSTAAAMTSSMYVTTSTPRRPATARLTTTATATRTPKQNMMTQSVYSASSRPATTARLSTPRRSSANTTTTPARNMPKTLVRSTTTSTKPPVAKAPATGKVVNGKPPSKKEPISQNKLSKPEGGPPAKFDTDKSIREEMQVEMGSTDGERDSPKPKGDVLPENSILLEETDVDHSKMNTANGPSSPLEEPVIVAESKEESSPLINIEESPLSEVNIVSAPPPFPDVQIEDVVQTVGVEDTTNTVAERKEHSTDAPEAKEQDISHAMNLDGEDLIKTAVEHEEDTPSVLQVKEQDVPHVMDLATELGLALGGSTGLSNEEVTDGHEVADQHSMSTGVDLATELGQAQFFDVLPVNHDEHAGAVEEVSAKVMESVTEIVHTSDNANVEEQPSAEEKQTTLQEQENASVLVADHSESVFHNDETLVVDELTKIEQVNGFTSDEKPDVDSIELKYNIDSCGDDDAKEKPEAIPDNESTSSKPPTPPVPKVDMESLLRRKEEDRLHNEDIKARLAAVKAKIGRTSPPNGNSAESEPVVRSNSPPTAFAAAAPAPAPAAPAHPPPATTISASTAALLQRLKATGMVKNTGVGNILARHASDPKLDAPEDPSVSAD